ncbi:MAG: adenosine deaminase [Acidobacteriota bacterium]
MGFSGRSAGSRRSLRAASPPGRAARTIRGLPKIDLHVHLEGSMPRATMRALAQRHGMRIPACDHHADMRGFLKAFGSICDLLVDAEDFHRAASDLFRMSRRLGVVHMEVLFSPQVFLRRGIALSTIMRGLVRARVQAMTDGELTLVYIADAARQWGGEWFDEMVRALEPYTRSGVAGVGVGGDEKAVPAAAFAAGFRRARRMGLRTTIHAGEAAGADSVRDVLETLRPDRIGHGVRAVEDTGVIRALVESGTPLEICPTSNTATGCVSSLARHPVRRLIEAGVTVTINSDDGSLFDTDIERELARLVDRLSFSRREIIELMLDAADAAFLPASGRRRLRHRILAGSAGRGRPKSRPQLEDSGAASRAVRTIAAAP